MIHRNTKILNKFFIFLIPIFFFGWLGMSSVISHIPRYDDAYNATIAKNISYGLGYVSSYDSLVKFNPEVTTGPSLVLPAAFIIKIFGNKYWTPAFSSFLVSLVLFCTTSFLFASYIKENIYYDNSNYLFFLIPFALLLFWSSEIKHIEFLGEFPASLFFCAGSTLIFLRNTRFLPLFFGGILLGLSVTTKMIMLLLVVPLLFFWFLLCIYNKKTIKKNIVLALFVFFSVAIPAIAFEIQKMVSLGLLEFIQLKYREIIFVKVTGSGLQELSSATNFFNHIWKNGQNNLILFQSNVGELYFYIYIIAVFVIVAFYVKKIICKDILKDLDRFALSLLLSIVAYYSWWLFFNTRGWYRHVSPAVDVTSFAILVSGYALMGRKTSRIIVFVIFAWLVMSPTKIFALFGPPSLPVEQKYALEKASNYLYELKKDGATLMGCGWWANRRLEYIMPGVLNFRECRAGTFENSYLVIDRDFWDWEKVEGTSTVAARCNQLVFEIKPYEVYRCR